MYLDIGVGKRGQAMKASSLLLLCTLAIIAALTFLTPPQYLEDVDDQRLCILDQSTSTEDDDHLQVHTLSVMAVAADAGFKLPALFLKNHTLPNAPDSTRRSILLL